MRRIVIVGSGPAGMTAALLLARDGHQVTLVDRDPGPPGHGEWRRIGVMQFHLPHGLRAQGRAAIAERLPDVHAALIEAGGLLFTPPGAPESAAMMRIRRSTLERDVALRRPAAGDHPVGRARGRAGRGQRHGSRRHR